MPVVVRVIPIKDVPFSDAKVRKELEAALQETGKAMVRKFKQTTLSWHTDVPTMNAETEIGGNEASVWAGPEGTEKAVAKWKGIDQGIPPHPIVHRNAPMLVFPWQGPKQSYAAGTKPRWFGSAWHYRLGPTYRTLRVRHPGIYEPRQWSDQMAVEEAGPFAERVQAAIDRGLER